MSIKKPDTLTLIAAGAIVTIVLLTAYLGSIAINNDLITLLKLAFPRSSSVTPNPDALYFTNPVMNFSGAKITRRSADAIWVEVATPPIGASPLIVPPPAGGPATGPQTPTIPESKKLNFKIAITDSTTITKPTTFIPYAFKQQAPLLTAPPALAAAQPNRLTIDDLSDGEVVDIFLAEDLRFAKGNTLKASSITKRVNSNTLSGPIESISGNALKIKATLQTYTISITGDTEMTTYGQTGPKEINLDALKTGAYITVYSASPIDGTSFTAAKIDLAPSMLIAPATPK